MTTKKCTYCKKDKPLSEYYPIKNAEVTGLGRNRSNDER